MEFEKDRPWIIRTYAGHTNVKETNRLFRNNLAKGQVGLSIAFDLPTQCGYSSDDSMAQSEVGKVGVPINTVDDFHLLFDQIPIDQINTSMTINGTAMWLLSLYIVLAEEQGMDLHKLRGTTQNDMMKEFLARGTYVFPPEESIRLTVDMYEHCLQHIPRWNPSNICSYHLREAGATPTQEVAFTFITAITILDAIQERGRFSEAEFHQCVGRISFFVNAGIRFVEEFCKMRTFTELWDEICQERYGVENPKFRRFRYGVQTNSLGLSEEQPENNAWRTMLSTLGVTLSRNARCKSLQLPAWNEALSLPRPWDQQWSLRMQQILAYETDLLEYPDLFDGSPVVKAKVEQMKKEVRAEIEKIQALGGGIEAIKSGYMKGKLVESQSKRLAKINSGEEIMVGKNRWTTGLTSPLMDDHRVSMFKIDPEATQEALLSLKATKANRDAEEVAEALAQLTDDAKLGHNLMSASLRCARARVSTGEWTATLKKVFGEYRSPTGVEGQSLDLENQKTEVLRQRVEIFQKNEGHRPRFLVGKAGLDGHSNGAEMIAIAASHVGFDVSYFGIRHSADVLVKSAIEEDVDLIGLSILSGSHLEVVDQLLQGFSSYGASNSIPLFVGGIIPECDIEQLKTKGVQEVFTPKDHDLMEVMARVMDVLEARV